MHKINNLNTKELREYKKLTDALLKTDNLYTIRSLIQSHIKRGGKYISRSSTEGSRNLGDCNGDGSIDILDIVLAVDMVLNGEYDECGDMNSDGTVDVLDVVNLVNLVLYGDGGELDDSQIIDRVLVLQKLGDASFRSFDSTSNLELGEDGIGADGYILEDSTNPDNVVLITAPHAQNHYRPTRWNTLYEPASGLKYCTEENLPSCHKDDDYCTGAMAKTIAELSGASVLYTRGKQSDPNYYDYLDSDYYCREASSNVGSGNEADPASGYYNYGGIQTETFYNEFILQQRHPFKMALLQYLDSHPEIKLVIDLHGASASNNHWDLDLGLIGNTGADGINTQDNVTWASESNLIGPIYPSTIYDCWPYQWWSSEPTIEMDFLYEIMGSLWNFEIGHCDYNCPAGINSGCELEGFCPEGITGHGPISFNDFAGANQWTVTKFVNGTFGGSVKAIQLEVSDYYRCLEGRDETNMVKLIRAVEDIIYKANSYYGNNRTYTEDD